MIFKTFSIMKTNNGNVNGGAATLATLGLAIAMTACAPKDGPKTKTKPATVETPAISAVIPAPKYLSRMACGGVGSAAGFERSYVVYVQDGTISFIKGDIGQSGYEYWGGTVTVDGKVTIDGTYEDTPGQPRVISFTGTVTETSMNLSGDRGPRACTVIGKLPNA